MRARPGRHHLQTERLWYFGRFIARVDAPAVLETADGSRSLVDADHVHALDVVVGSEGAGS